MLQRQVDLLARRKFFCSIASELEFFLFNTSYHDAFAAHYRDLAPSSDYRVDYQIMQPTRDEPLFRSIRNMMGEAGVPIESSKGEWGRGQHEINFPYADPIGIADLIDNRLQIILGKVRPLSRPLTEAHPQVLIIARFFARECDPLHR